MSAAVVELLRAGRERVARGFTKGTFARDASGELVSVYSPDAVCFCAAGAIDIDPRAEATDLYAEAGEALELALPARWERRLALFNDDAGTTQADVLALFDRAIAAAEAQS